MDINSLQSGSNLAYATLDTASTPEAHESKTSLESSSQGSNSTQSNITEIIVSEQTKEKVATADTLTVEKIATAVSEVSNFVQSKNQDLSFSFDEDSNRPIIKVTDASSGDVIRQIPSEEVLKMSERIRELQSDVGEKIGLGVLLNNQV